MIRLLMMSLCLCIVVACTHRSEQNISELLPARPNIMIILLDDLGYSDIGFFGGEINTPNMDALARNGVSYTQFYVYPRCSPTRAALLTGANPHQVGLAYLTTPANADVPKGPYQGYIDPSAPTMAEILKAAGYRTYMSGKWHLGEGEAHWPRKRGFDHYFGLISGASSYYELLNQGTRKRRMALNDDSWTPPTDGFFMTDATTTKAQEYLTLHAEQSSGKSSDGPFFLYLAYTAPHWPLHAPEKDIAAYDGVYDRGWSEVRAARIAAQKERGILPQDFSQTSPPDTVGSWEDYDDKQGWAKKMQIHAAMVSHADRGIGEIINTLRDQGELENTLIFVFSDNGAAAEDVSNRGLNDASAAIGAKGSYVSFGQPGAYVANTPLLENKGSTYEGGIRSPLIAHWPAGMTRTGRIDQASVLSVLDVLPTVLEVTASLVPKQGPDQQSLDLAGISIADGLRNDSVLPDHPIYWEHLGWRAVRDKQWKAVSAPETQSWKLFDLSSDPAERLDLASTHPEVLARLDVNWHEWSMRVGAVPVPLKEIRKIFSPKQPKPSGDDDK